MIVRKMDGLGRIVIPIETREILKMEEGDPIEIHANRKSIILKKYSPIRCNNCGTKNVGGKKWTNIQ